HTTTIVPLRSFIVINLLIVISLLIRHPLSIKSDSTLKSTARMSYRFKFNCLNFSLLLFFMLLFQSGIAQKSAKNVKELGINRFPSLDALLVQNQKPLGNNFVAMIWTDTLVYKKEVGEFESK